jgi:hypothetical protein
MSNSEEFNPASEQLIVPQDVDQKILDAILNLNRSVNEILNLLEEVLNVKP